MELKIQVTRPSELKTYPQSSRPVLVTGLCFDIIKLIVTSTEGLTYEDREKNTS